jgi:hypothetical protein
VADQALRKAASRTKMRGKSVATAKSKSKPQKTGEKSSRDKGSSGAEPAVTKPTVEPHEGKLHSPIVPLLWLLIPFVGVIVYGYLTGE